MRVDQLSHAAKLAERRTRAQEMLKMVRDKPADTEVAVLYMNEYHKIYVPALLLGDLLERLVGDLGKEMNDMGIRF